MDIDVQFVPWDEERGKKPPNLVVEAEVHFVSDCGPFTGLKLVGFAIRRNPDGGTYITLPSRAFGNSADRRYFDFVRAIDGDHRKTDAVKDVVRRAWKLYQRQP